MILEEKSRNYGENYFELIPKRLDRDLDGYSKYLARRWRTLWNRIRVSQDKGL
jgi:hypothetical protein